MEDKWIYLPEGGYPKNKSKVHVLVLSLFRDPYYDKGAPGVAYASSATFEQDDEGTRKWSKVITEGGSESDFINETEYFEAFDFVNENHPDGSWDSYIVAWQPMPTVPEKIVWPERKPVSRVTQILQCPICKSQPPKNIDPDEYRYCPRCGRAWKMEYVPVTITSDKE